MSGSQDLEVFRRLGEDNRLRAWIDRERTLALSYLIGATDSVAIHRAQGQVHLIDKMIELIDKAKLLR